MTPPTVDEEVELPKDFVVEVLKLSTAQKRKLYRLIFGVPDEPIIVCKE